MGLGKNLNSMNSIGYKELYNFCKEREIINDINSLSSEDKKILNEIIELIKKNSRNYAKRQLTWFKKEKDVIWIDL